MGDIPNEIARLVGVLRSWIPDGDGYNSQYAHDMEAAAHMLEQLAVQRKHHRARHKSYKRRFREADASLAGLRAFAQDVMETWPEAAPDGFDLQEYATKHGLLRPVEMKGPCGDDCGCTEYLSAEDWPSTCYRKTSLLTGKPENDAAIDRLLTIGTAGHE